ncbi:MAG: hypothetical protein ACI4SQ_02940, partial [Eubacterium sp.]
MFPFGPIFAFVFCMIVIVMKGMNSELGTDLELFVKPGANAKIEYATGSVSWNTTSDAKITVTAQNGQERIYYISYSKSTEQCNIRGISSKLNTLKKVYLSSGYYDNTLYIIGKNKELDTDDSLKIQTNPGYSATYSADDKKIVVKEEETGAETSYSVRYTQDVSGFSMKDVQSQKSTIYSVEISSYSSSVSETQEQYYQVDLLGEEKECPTDLNPVVSQGATTTVTYAGEDWPYSAYAAKIEVTDGTYTQMYLVMYKQDDSGTVVKGIEDKENSYVYT